MKSDADPASLRRALDDPDEYVRADAAAQLAALGDPGALEASIRTLDDGADPAHVDITPAVRALSAMGEQALPALLAPLDSDDRMTRLHAQRAVEGVFYAQHGFRAGQGFPSPADESRVRAELTAIGYAYDAAPEQRRAALARLRDRLAATDSGAG
jgi:hypothetical protein